MNVTSERVQQKMDQDNILEKRQQKGILLHQRLNRRIFDEKSGMIKKRYQKKNKIGLEFLKVLVEIEMEELAQERRMEKGEKNNELIMDAASGLASPLPPPLPLNPRPAGEVKMPEALLNVIESHGGTSIVWVIEKTLYKTDLSRGHNRLTMPGKQMKEAFLTKEERERLRKETNGGMKVVVVDPECRFWTLNFTRWNSFGSSYSYVLNGAWNDLVALQEWRPKVHSLQVWSFRLPQPAQGSNLCFVLNVVPTKLSQ
uniref:Uncharacterized protein n=1 Tax=Nelumbo nucifera TaxID=4432 RepID=A0A822XP24_NELNU|nr:TPA_asm: hypothetical protein HUJ06_023623 [Nelumbo nucifera]